jgi:inhibitor of cysteine peptidase
VKIKLAGLFMVFICFAMVTGSFATTPNNNHSKDVTLKIIKVSSNPSTGYYWVAEYNHSQAKLVKESYKSNNPKLMGSSGIQTFVFIGAQGTKITLKYCKVGTNVPVKQHTYTL